MLCFFAFAVIRNRFSLSSICNQLALFHILLFPDYRCQSPPARNLITLTKNSICCMNRNEVPLMVVVLICGK